MMGAVIGKGGASINEIRSMSGADIKIGDNEPGNPMRLVTVTGSPEQIQLAQYLIQIKMGGGQLPSAQQFALVKTIVRNLAMAREQTYGYCVGVQLTTAAIPACSRRPLTSSIPASDWRHADDRTTTAPLVETMATLLARHGCALLYNDAVSTLTTQPKCRELLLEALAARGLRAAPCDSRLPSGVVTLTGVSCAALETSCAPSELSSTLTGEVGRSPPSSPSSAAAASSAPASSSSSSSSSSASEFGGVQKSSGLSHVLTPVLSLW